MPDVSCDDTVTLNCCVIVNRNDYCIMFNCISCS